MKRFKHSLNHDRKISCNMGLMIPIMLRDILPGSSIRHKPNVFLRMAPMLAPVMHRLDVDVRTFFVANRTIWDDFEDFITSGPDGEDDTVPPYVTIPSGGFLKGSMADYFGLPILAGAGQQVSALPFRALNFIYNEFYRDQDLMPERVFSKGSGSDTTTDLSLPRAAWYRDYFTKARTTPQKGPDVFIPLLGDAPVKSVFNTGGNQQVQVIQGGLDDERVAIAGQTVANSGFYTDLETSSAVSIDDLRIAAAVERYQEDNSRFGNRYPEFLLNNFGVVSPDARLSIPEYLGGARSPVQFSEVLQTSQTDSDQPLGQLGGHGVNFTGNGSYRYHAKEHGWLITVMVVRPKTAYQQGVEKMWTRNTRLDYFDPHFANLGQQEILNKEIDISHANPDDVWGYVDRHEEYKTIPSGVSGDFRDTLDFWHMGRKFASPPVLNADFVSCTPTTRIFAVTESDPLWCYVDHRISMRNTVPTVSKPKLF